MLCSPSAIPALLVPPEIDQRVIKATSRQKEGEAGGMDGRGDGLHPRPWLSCKRLKRGQVMGLMGKQPCRSAPGVLQGLPGRGRGQEASPESGYRGQTSSCGVNESLIEIEPNQDRV